MTRLTANIRVLAFVACVLVGFGCSLASAGGTVSGTATYRERMALPPDAVLEVKLQDVSLADAPAVELGSVRIENPGSPPFENTLAVRLGRRASRWEYAALMLIPFVLIAFLTTSPEGLTPIWARALPWLALPWAVWACSFSGLAMGSISAPCVR